MHVDWQTYQPLERVDSKTGLKCLTGFRDQNAGLGSGTGTVTYKPVLGSKIGTRD